MPTRADHSIRSAAHAIFIRLAWFVRRLPGMVRGKDLLLTRKASPPCLAIGKGYGTWYVVPKLLKRGDLAYCFGLGREISFERALAEDHGMEVHAFDPTPHSLEWLESQALPASMIIHPLGIADIDGVLDFAPPAVEGHVSMSAVRETDQSEADLCSLEVRTLPSLLDALHPGRQIALLKMDIEGSEYGVIQHMVAHGIRPLQLLVEFHHRFSEVGPGETRRAANTLKDLGYVLVHVSPNGEEMTFVRIDQLSAAK
jgi:FkbM family methyltransferase